MKVQKLSVASVAHMAVMILPLQGGEDNSLLHPHNGRKWLYSSPRLPQLAYTQGQALVNDTTVGYIFQPTKAAFRLAAIQSSSFGMWSWGHGGQWKDFVRLHGIQTQEISFAPLQQEAAHKPSASMQVSLSSQLDIPYLNLIPAKISHHKNECDHSFSHIRGEQSKTHQSDECRKEEGWVQGQIRSASNNHSRSQQVSRIKNSYEPTYVKPPQDPECWKLLLDLS